MTNKLVTLTGFLWLSGLACGAQTTIGDVPDGAEPNLQAVGTSGHKCTPPQFAGDQPFTFPAGVAGVWTGYVQGGITGLNSDAVRLTLDQAADGTNQIHVVYGSAPPPPPATSATDYYPNPQPGVPNADIPSGTPIEGFSYLAHNVNWQAQGTRWRLRFLVDSAEPWASWCQLQSSYATHSGDLTSYNCIPNLGYRGPDPNGGGCVGVDSSGHPIFTVSCAQMTMCIFGFCSCDACGCDMPGVSFAGIPSGPDTVDILFDTDSVTGAFQLMRAAN